MARNDVFLLVGPDIPEADLLHDHLAGNPEVLAAVRLTVPRVTSRDLDLSGIELLRTHKAHGLRRRDVEGTWARVCRRAWKSKSDTVVVVPGLAAANKEQVALALDTLSGLRVHVIVSGTLPAWEQQLKSGRFHRVTADSREQFVDAVVRIVLDARLLRLEKRIAKLRKASKGKKKKPQLAA